MYYVQFATSAFSTGNTAETETKYMNAIINIGISNRNKSRPCTQEWQTIVTLGMYRRTLLTREILFGSPSVMSVKYTTTQSNGMFNSGGGGRECGYIFVPASWVIGYAPPSLHESHVTTPSDISARWAPHLSDPGNFKLECW